MRQCTSSAITHEQDDGAGSGANSVTCSTHDDRQLVLCIQTVKSPSTTDDKRTRLVVYFDRIGFVNQGRQAGTTAAGC